MPVVTDIEEQEARGHAVAMSSIISPTLTNALAGLAAYESDEDDDMPDPVSNSESSEEEEDDDDNARANPFTKPSTQHFPESHVRLFCEKEMHKHVLASVAAAATIAQAAGLNTSTKTKEDKLAEEELQGKIAAEEEHKDRLSKLDKLGEKPKLASIERARKCSKARSAITKPHSRKPAPLSVALKRVDEFGDPLHIKNNALHCSACPMYLCTKKSTVANHLASTKHKKAVLRAEQNALKGKDVQHDIEEYDKANPGAAGSTLAMCVRKQRYEVAELFLAAGVPLHKLDMFRDFFRDLGLNLTSAHHMKEVVPQIVQAEERRVYSEISKQYVSFTFDGTSRSGDCINGIVRWCSEDFELEMRLTLFVTLQVSADGDSLKRLLGHHLMNDLRLTTKQLVSFHRDSCATNGVAIRALTEFYPATHDILCFPHIMSCMGDKIIMPVLDRFMTAYVTMLSQSHAAKNLWQGLLGHYPRSFSGVRWFSKAEISMEFAENAHLLPDFVLKLEQNEIAPALTRTLRDIIDNHFFQFSCDCALMLDCKNLTILCHELEGDRCEGLVLYNRIEALRDHGRVFGTCGTTPNLDAVVRDHIEPKKGTKVAKVFPNFGLCTGQIISSNDFDSTLYPGKVVKGFTVKYDSDGSKEDYELDELKTILDIRDVPERVATLYSCILSVRSSFK